MGVARTFLNFREASPEWHEVDSSTTAGIAKVSRAASTSGESHYLMNLSVSYDTDAKTGLCKIYNGTTSSTDVLYQFYAHDSDHVEFDAPPNTGANTALTITLQGAASAIGTISAMGFTAAQ